MSPLPPDHDIPFGEPMGTAGPPAPKRPGWFVGLSVAVIAVASLTLMFQAMGLLGLFMQEAVAEWTMPPPPPQQAMLEPEDPDMDAERDFGAIKRDRSNCFAFSVGRLGFRLEWPTAAAQG